MEYWNIHFFSLEAESETPRQPTLIGEIHSSCTTQLVNLACAENMSGIYMFFM